MGGSAGENARKKGIKLWEKLGVRSPGSEKTEGVSGREGAEWDVSILGCKAVLEHRDAHPAEGNVSRHRRFLTRVQVSRSHPER